MEILLIIASVGASWCAALLLAIVLNLVAPSVRRLTPPVIRILALGFWPAWIAVNILLLWLLTDLGSGDNRDGGGFLAVALFFVAWGIFGLAWVRRLGTAARRMVGAEDRAGPNDP